MSVTTAQRRLGVFPTGLLDPATVDALRAFQAGSGFWVTGELDANTVAALAARELGFPIPLWYQTSDEDDNVRSRLGDTDPDTVRRFQSAAGLEPTGVIDEDTARRIGD